MKKKSESLENEHQCNVLLMNWIFSLRIAYGPGGKEYVARLGKWGMKIEESEVEDQL